MKPATTEDYFIFKCWQGLEDRGLSSHPEYRKRLDFEIQTVQKMGFSGYFLIVADFINWARTHGILVGPGRGSAAGSLAAYCLRITNVDPIRYGLLFERFLNPDRISMPDVDIDFQEERRQEVIEYVTAKYGADHVAQIGTFGTMKAKGAIRDVARTLGLPLSTGDKLAKLVPPPVHGKPVPLKDAVLQDNELAKYYLQKTTPESDTISWALKLEGTIRSYGTHASGVVISPVPLTQLVPLARGKGDVIATQVDMGGCEDVGLIKFDFLGLRTLSVIQLCCSLVRKFHGINLDPDELPLDDEATFNHLRSGDTVGIFQLETSGGMRDLLIKVRPNSLEDLAILVAAFRPGPLGSAGMEMYLGVRAGERDPEYPFPELAPILEPTGGWIIYQEQVMHIARALCGYTPGMADDLRKAVGKKKEEEMAKHEKLFVEGAVSRGHDRDRVQELYDSIKKFASYGFNKSHAVSYGLITYITAYLKTHFPVEFMCAALTCDYDNSSKVIKYISECRSMGIQVLPPDVNESSTDFSVSTPSGKGGKYLGAIRFGLAAVKNLGPEPVRHIVGLRGVNPYASILEFCQRVDTGKINRKKVESLVLCGAFDSGGYTRTSLLSAIDSFWSWKEEQKKYETKLETYEKRKSAWEERERAIADLTTLGVKKKPAHLKEPTKPEAPPIPSLVSIPEMSDDEILSNEKELLGFYISGHPLDKLQPAIESSGAIPIEQLADLEQNLNEEGRGVSVVLAGLVSSLTEKQTRKGELMCFGSFEDRSGEVEMLCFGTIYKKYHDLLHSGKPLLLRAKLEVEKTYDESGDELGSSTRIIPFSITELLTGEIVREPIRLAVKPESTTGLMALLQKYSGNGQVVSVRLKTDDGSLWGSQSEKRFEIGAANESSFLRDLGRLLN